MKIDVGLIKSYIKDYPVDNIVYHIGSTHEVLCNLLIGTELLWEGHESGDWIIDKEATDTLTGRRHKECTRCGKLLESEIYASDTYNEKYFTFYAASGGLSIEAKEGVTLVGEIAIPSTYRGESVTHINPDAFKNCTDITKITIPKSIVSIGDRAFQGCNDIESVEFAKGSQLTDIGVEAFDDCDSLTSIVIPDSVTSIGDYAFYSCGNLATVVIGDNVETIGERAFAWCWDLQKVVIPDSVTSIGGYTFAYCDEDLVIYCEAASQPEGWDSRWNDGNRRVIWDWNCLSGHKWGDWTFDEATGIGHRECKVCGEHEERSDVLIFAPNIDGTYFVSAGEGLEGGIVIPSTYKGMPVATIFDWAFSNCSNLTSVVIPDSVTTIGRSAFERCTSLSSVVIPDSITSIGIYTFAYCESLTNVVIPDSVTSIGFGAFVLCKNLSSVVIGDSVTSIGEQAFWNCFSLTRVVIPDSVTTIERHAFYFCRSLNSITIPKSVTSIGIGAFGACSNLTIEVAEGNTHYKVEGGCLIEIESNEITFGNQYSTIPSTASSIGGDAFTGTYAAPIKIPLSIITIDSLAFRDCENLVLHVEAPSKPEGWADDWNDGSVTVVWGYVEDTNTYLVTESGEFLTDEQGNLLIL